MSNKAIYLSIIEKQFQLQTSTDLKEGKEMIAAYQSGFCVLPLWYQTLHIKQKCVLCNAGVCRWKEKESVWFSIWTCKCSVSVCWKAPVSLSNCSQTGVLKHFLRHSRHQSASLVLTFVVDIYFLYFFPICNVILNKSVSLLVMQIEK